MGKGAGLRPTRNMGNLNRSRRQTVRVDNIAAWLMDVVRTCALVNVQVHIDVIVYFNARGVWIHLNMLL